MDDAEWSGLKPITQGKILTNEVKAERCKGRQLNGLHGPYGSYLPLS